MTGKKEAIATEGKNLRGPTTRAVITEEERIDCILKINEHGAITIPKKVRDKLEVCCEGKLLVLTIAKNGIEPIIMLIPVNSLSKSER